MSKWGGGVSWEYVFEGVQRRDRKKLWDNSGEDIEWQIKKKHFEKRRDLEEDAERRKRQKCPVTSEVYASRNSWRNRLFFENTEMKILNGTHMEPDAERVFESPCEAGG